MQTIQPSPKPGGDKPDVSIVPCADYSAAAVEAALTAAL